MKLRSSRVLKRGKPKIRLPLSSNKSNSGKKRANKDEIGVCVDKCGKNIVIGMKEVVNTDDKGLFLGSEVLDPIKEERVQIEEGNESVSLNLSETGRPDFNEEIKSPNVECENGSENLKSETFIGDTTVVNSDDNKEALLNDTENVNVVNKRKRKKGFGRCGRNKKNVSDVEITVMPLERKRERKRKNVESECNGDERAKKGKVENGGGVHVSGRVLRSRSLTLTTVSGGDVADDGGLSGTIFENRGRKKRLKKRGRPRKVQNETKDGNTRPKKKLKCARGRPRKMQDEITISPLLKVERRGKPRKVQGDITVLPLVKKDGILIEKSRKKVETRGRPRKTVSNEIHSGPTKSRGKIQKKRIKNMIFKKLKRRTRTPKMEAKKVATHVMKMRSVKLKAVKKRPEIQKIQKIEKIQKDEENSGGVIGEHFERRKIIKQLIRDKISDMLLKSGWKIDLRQRQFKSYKDAVYIEPNGKRSHWSITRAYAMLKKKIEINEADNNEISAYSPIPEEEISMLFRHVNKELGYKKKKKKKVKNSNRGKIVKIVTDKKKEKNGSKKVTDTRKPRLLARGSENGSKKDNDGVLVNKKRNLLSWMIDSGVILDNSKVKYGKTRRKKRLFEGMITNDGICCNCCNEIMGISEFVSHCGGKISRIFDDLYLESGTCFRKCLMDSWKKEELNIIKFNFVDVKDDDPNDDTCNICGDGGNLICCDGCPSTFHQSCLDIQNFPSGDWNCIYCSCKFCGVFSVSTPQVEDCHDEITSEMLTCRLCEEKFHKLCLQEVEDVNKDSDKLPFCGKICEEVFERLQTYLGVKHELEDGFSWTLLQRCDINQELTVHETELKVEHNSKLAVAFSVMDECFVPIIDERSGINIIHNVVYNCGSNFRRLNYAGFLTAVLEKGDELITTASIRIHGYRSAEMPFIGTRHMYRRQGMCRRLLDAIESALYSFGVEELIIPAIPQLLQTWTKVFGFMPLEDSKNQEIKSMSMIVFPGIDMLKKPLNQNHNSFEASDDKPVETVSSNVTEYRETPLDALDGVGKDVINHKQTEETIDAISVEKDTINDEQTEEPTVGKDTINDEQTEERTVGKDIINHKHTEEPTNAISVRKDTIHDEQTEEPSVGKDIINQKQTEEPTNAISVWKDTINDEQTEELSVGKGIINHKQTEEPTNAISVGKDTINDEQTEEPTVGKDIINHKQTEEPTNAISVGKDTINDEQTEEPSVGKGIINHKQTEETTDAIIVEKDTINDEQTEEPTVGKDITHLENDDITISHDDISVCDLNLPVKDILPCDTDGQTSVDSECNSVISGNHELTELKLDVDNDDGIDKVKVKPSPLTSELVMKNVFDLNLQPTVVETDMHIIVDQSDVGQPESKSCESQPLVLL